MKKGLLSISASVFAFYFLFSVFALAGNVTDADHFQAGTDTDICMTEHYIYILHPYTAAELKKDIPGVCGVAGSNEEGLHDADKVPTGGVVCVKKDGEVKKYTVILPGDVDKNGQINSSDARFLLRSAAKLEKIEDVLTFTAAQIDSGYQINSRDARIVLRMAAKLNTDEISLNTNITDRSNHKWAAVLQEVYADSEGKCDISIFQSDSVRFLEDFQGDSQIEKKGTVYLQFDDTMNHDQILDLLYHIYSLNIVTDMIPLTGNVN